MGVKNDIILIDISTVKEPKIIGTIQDAHINGVLSINFDHSHPYSLISSGLDCSIKIWDTRRLSDPVSTLFFNNWVYSTKFNESYSRMILSCFTNPNVKVNIFENFSNKGDELISNINYCKYKTIDYNEFDNAVYALDWLHNDPWSFAAISFNCNFQINSVPDDVKYKIMLDN